eukprot:TRINITY_DN884_c0_g1_i1.p1 TRINITY_DN884_c0_g1~~TRINITY_DN884_c0_g1_i1.p1  ORF type:complete len:165 (+),score=23.43 TRINITY_DN884_c0_g1_i1:44-538(+)
MAFCLCSRSTGDEDSARKSLLRGPPSFSLYAQQNFFENELAFYQATQKFQKENFPTAEAMRSEARKIYETFLMPDAPREIGLNQSTMRSVTSNIAKPHPSLYQSAMLEVGGVLHSRLVEYARAFGLDVAQLQSAASADQRDSIPLRTIPISHNKPVRRSKGGST